MRTTKPRIYACSLHKITPNKGQWESFIFIFHYQMLDELLGELERADQSVETNVDNLEEIESAECDKAPSVNVETNHEDELKKKASNEKASGFRCVFTLNASLRPKKGDMASGVSSNSHKATGGVDVAPLSEVKFVLVGVLPVSFGLLHFFLKNNSFLVLFYFGFITTYFTC